MRYRYQHIYKFGNLCHSHEKILFRKSGFTNGIWWGHYNKSLNAFSMQPGYSHVIKNNNDMITNSVQGNVHHSIRPVLPLLAWHHHRTGMTPPARSGWRHRRPVALHEPQVRPVLICATFRAPRWNIKQQPHRKCVNSQKKIFDSPIRRPINGAIHHKSVTIVG